MGLGAVLVLGSGCQISEDDEMVQPTRTITASPSAAPTAAPDSVPVGHGPVSTDDVVWSQGSALHVGDRTVDLAPVTIESFVVVPGGVFLLASGELWLTDLTRLRGTGITDVTALGVTADASRVLVTAAGSAYAYDTISGRGVGPQGLEPLSAQRRIDGPSRAGVTTPAGFEVAGWAGEKTFYGTGSEGGRPTTVVSCSLESRTCARLGAVEGTEPVLFGAGK